MSFSNENINYYSLFGPSNQPNQSAFQITTQSRAPLTNSINTIQRPIKKIGQTSTKLFVGNLPPGTTLHELFVLFEKYGKINMNLSVVKEDNYAFIHYYNEADAQIACEQLNNSLLKSRYIRVQFSHSLGHVSKVRSEEISSKRIPQSKSLFSINNDRNTSNIDQKSIGRPIRGVNFGIKTTTHLPQSQSIDQFIILQSYIKLKEQQDKLLFVSNWISNESLEKFN